MSDDRSPRLVTVWCPDWPVVAARAAGVVPSGADEAFAVLHANRVVARSVAAAYAGVRKGQRRRDAQRCCPELVLIDHDPSRDAREFEPVIGAVAEKAPRLDVIEPGWITLAAKGPCRYYGGDQAVADVLGRLVSRLTGAPVGVGIADGRVASAVAARRAVAPIRGQVGSEASAASTVVPPAGSPAYLAPLPVAWLSEVGDADAELIEVLSRLGIRTLGEFAALPATDVLARFGRAGAHAHRRAGGRDDRPPVVGDPLPEHRAERVFDDPVDQVSSVVFVAKQLADDLVASLSAEGRVCVRLLVVAETRHGERSERSWYRDGGLTAAAMVERVRWQLDGWIAGSTGRTAPGGGSDAPVGITAGITLVRLVVDEARGDGGEQLGLWGGRSQADDAAARAITRLVGLAGDDAVRVPVWHGGRLPADRYRWVAATSVDLDDPARRLVSGDGPWPGCIPAPSPAVVPPDARPIDLFDGCGERVRIGGRGDVSGAPVTVMIDGVGREVTAWAGPWPLDQVWWDSRRRRRVARLQLVTDGGVALLVVAERQRWWVIAQYA